jgi:hypothetical protein
MQTKAQPFHKVETYIIMRVLQLHFPSKETQQQIHLSEQELWVKCGIFGNQGGGRLIQKNAAPLFYDKLVGEKV